MPGKANDDDDIRAMGAMVDITYAVIAHMRTLQVTHGGFQYDDLAAFVMTKYGYAQPVAQAKVNQIVSHLTQMMEQHGTMFRMIEEAPPTIAETIDGWKRMAAQLLPKKQVQPSVTPIPRRTPNVDVMRFEQYRPKPCADRWLRNAPEYVIACYDNETTEHRYTIVFGGTLWDTNFARVNWQAGLDPRLTPCLSMSGDPAQSLASWGQCLRGRHLGRMVCWLDLPTMVRSQVRKRVEMCRR